MAEKTILILGGGVGGIVAARELRRHLGSNHRIILIDRSDVFSFPPSYLWVMIGWRKPASIQKPLVLLEKHGIEFRHECIQAIHPEQRTVATDRGDYRYDYLVIALGADLEPQSIPGLPETAHSFYTLDQAEELSRILPDFSGGTISIVIAGIPYKCPPAPYEAALLLEAYFSRRSTRKCTLELYTPEDIPLAVAGPEAGRIVEELLRQRGISLHARHTLASVDTTRHQMLFDDGSSARFDLLIAVPPHRAPGLVQAARLTNESGWIQVDRQTLRKQGSDIFALGDVSTILLSNGLALPKTGVFAASQAEIVAHTIAREIHNAGPRKEFDGTGYCFLETGNGRAGYISGSFFAAPQPRVTLHEPSVTYHWGKVVFERYWLWRWF